ncbi:uncharacterized protein PHACADRAFT_255250 [Phanerochaete carnosa HHB-10118-sp]|uniref:Uncharacterized protein n=1 Tax=Phanerochaete carnosa (strain HHB-10118-sp) TaxID=650164 RepID=K5W750_PHACS|nr:uncharacterized protein PHACADRAFT_255250 [Phanerochaete carnosa HHB-10118-sp]EKM54985.1 hypothetical protein PHACADRAFT_255250 [Phanerochaete carnosa HHB-10118-sp]
MGLAKLGQRQGIVDDPTDPGPTSSFVPRGAHERVEEDGRERERKRKGKGVQRFRQNSYAFEAPHLIPVPMVHQGANPLLSAESGVPSGPTRKLPMQSSMQRLTPQDGVSTFTGPWDPLCDISASATLNKMAISSHAHQPLLSSKFRQPVRMAPIARCQA